MNRDIHSRLWAIRPWHIAVVLLCILMIVFGAFRVARRMELHNRIEAVRAAGYPVTLAELNTWQRTPISGENAADYVLRAISRLQIRQDNKKEWILLASGWNSFPRAQPLDDQTRSTISRVLADNAEALDLLERAAVMERCRYVIDFTQHDHKRAPGTGDFCNLAGLLCLKAALLTDQAEVGPAADATICAYHLADSLAEERSLNSRMIRRMCQQRATTTLARVLSRMSIDAGRLERLEQILAAACDPNTFERAFVGERCVMLDNFRRPMDFASVPASEELSFVRFQMGRASGGLDSAKTRHMDLMDRYITAARLPIRERVRAAAEIERESNRMRDNRVFLSEIMPSFHTLIVADVASIAHLLTARTALAVERYRLAAGRLPSQLTDLVPTYLEQVPQDPFDGQSLRYSRLEKGYVVYSVGRDLSDDGGKERAPGPGGQPGPSYDITFIVER